MTKLIVSGLMGFFTIPIGVLIICGIGFGGSEIGKFDLPLAPYWSGFGIFIGVGMLTICGFVLYENIPSWR